MSLRKSLWTEWRVIFLHCARQSDVNIHSDTLITALERTTSVTLAFKNRNSATAGLLLVLSESQLQWNVVVPDHLPAIVNSGRIDSIHARDIILVVRD